MQTIKHPHIWAKGYCARCGVKGYGGQNWECPLYPSAKDVLDWLGIAVSIGLILAAWYLSRG